MSEEFRVVPGYENYSVSKFGIVIRLTDGSVENQYLLNGYFIIDTCKGSPTTTLPVHRAVALAWVENTNPGEFIVVNHLDGNPINNRWDNLEWTTQSGNCYHAVNNGLRSDNIECEIRDFETGEVIPFSSIGQAAQFMGMRRDTPIYQLDVKQFGRLIKDRYEFRFANSDKEWFYENRKERVSKTRYMVIAKYRDGSLKEVFSNRAMLNEFQLYDSPWGKSMPGLTRYAREKFPEIEFVLRDSYRETRHRQRRNTKLSKNINVFAINGKQVFAFNSLRACASHFNVDRKSIVARLDNAKDLDGWIFTSLAT
ncbi:HNH endonuclease [Pseudomonas aeruginosa]|uniref:HNH endonuclease n=1 Tax=Pseudomonas aeruginosa TaxID=287 RepID=UPI003D2BF19D